MRTSTNTSKKTFRELGITYCMITAMRHFSDAQLLCRNNRSASSYLIAIRGMEEVGKALLFLDGKDLKKPGGHESKLMRFFESHPRLGKVNPQEWAKWYKEDANCARFVDIVDLGKYRTWIHPVLKFRNEQEVETLFSGIYNFIQSIFKNQAMIEEFEKLDPICARCYGLTPKNPCNRGLPTGHVLNEDYIAGKLNDPA